MNKENMELLEQINTNNVAFEIFNSLRGTSFSELKAICIAYTLQYIQQNKNLKIKDYNYFIENFNGKLEVKDILKENLKDCWDIVINLENKFYVDDLKAFILFNESFFYNNDPSYGTSKSISKLCCSIFDIKDKDRLLEICSGKGDFMVEVFKYMQSINFTGVESNCEQRDIAILRASLIDENINLILQDALLYKTDEKSEKVFSNYPFGIKLSPENKKAIIDSLDMPKDLLKTVSVEWLYNLKVLNCLSDNGKGIVISTNASTWNSRDEKIRKYFIKNGFIEAIISLPKLIYGTNIDTVLMIFSKNNKFVKMIDAREICIKNRTNDILSDKNIRDIVALLEDKNLENKKCINKNIEDLLNNECILNPIRYFEPAPEFKDGIEFGSLIKNITRGVQIKADEIEKIKSFEETNFKLISLTDINEGFIEFTENTKYLKEVPKNIEKYCIKNNNIILSKITTNTIKSAVAQVKENEYLFASGNLFIIELDETKLNPFFIQALFQSEIGNALFKSIYTGGVVGTVSLDKLKKMIIPLPSLEEQEKIANKYIDTINKYKQLINNIQKIKEEIKNIYK